MTFKEYFLLHTEAIKVDRLRKVRKAFDKTDKKKGKAKFRPGTFGFDIEFDYEQEPDRTEEWREYVYNNNHKFENEFERWLWKEHRIDWNSVYYDIDVWEEHNPPPDEVLPMDEPERSAYASEEEYEDARAVWTDHMADYEQYQEDREQWEESRDDAETEIDNFKSDEKYHWSDFADYIGDQMYDHLNSVPTSDDKLDEYENILERKLGQSVAREDGGNNDYENDWILSIDGSPGGPPEIASRILTTKDIPIVRSLLEYLEDEATSNGTSAHVHIGLPDGFDTFALFALFGLVDEKTIVDRLPDRKFGDYANLSDITIRKIKRVLEPIIKENKPLWKKTIRESGYSSIVSDESKENTTYHISVWVDENGRFAGKDDQKEEYTKFLKLYRNKDIEIVNNVPSKYRRIDRHRNPRSRWIHYTYKYINPELDPIKWEPIPIVKHREDWTLLDDTITKYIMDRIVEKFSGINISYFGERRTIEFRYLSSQILGDIDEFLKFIEYFLRVPDIAMRAKRINLNGLILRKTDSGIAAKIQYQPG